MALSAEEYRQLVADVKADLEAGSQGVRDVPTADSLDGVTSLPALQIRGTEKVVLVPLKLLSDPVYEAIASATPDFAAYCRNLYSEYVVKLLDEAQKYYPVQEDGWHFIDAANNVEVSITDAGLDASKIGVNLTALIKAIPGLGLALGIEPGTAFAGDKGNNLNKLVNSMRWLFEFATQVQENGFSIADANNNTGLKFDNEGLDTALLSTHLKSLIKEIDGLGLALGIEAGTAYAGDKGNTLNKLVNSMRWLFEFATQVQENGFSIADLSGNVGLKYDNEGLDAAKLSTNFMSSIRAVVESMNISIEGLAEVDEGGIFFTDPAGHIVASVTDEGLNWAITSSSSGIGYEVVRDVDYDV